MDCGLCHVCKNDASCEFPRNGKITQCEEYECARSSAPAMESKTPVALWAVPQKETATTGASRA
jgi:hypothetical protein